MLRKGEVKTPKTVANKSDRTINVWWRYGPGGMYTADYWVSPGDTLDIRDCVAELLGKYRAGPDTIVICIINQSIIRKHDSISVLPYIGAYSRR